MSYPHISIIMAVYNGESYLEDAINSVLCQTYRNFELIIVDDCSEDSTKSIVLSYQDGRIRYIKNHKNIGQTPSLNLALRQSRGKYIARIDDDDCYLNIKLEKQYLFMESHPEITVCGTSGVIIDENGSRLGLDLRPTNTADIYFRIFYRSPLNHVSVIMRRSVILGIGGYDERYPYCADIALWSKLIKNNYQIANLPEPLIKFRSYADSLGAINKLGPSGKEAIEIIYSNISDLLNIPISRKECRDIVFMLWPSTGMGIIDLSNAYLKLIAIAKESYNTSKPIRAVVNLNKYYLKSLVKRGLHFKSKKQFGLVSRDLLNIVRVYYKNPLLIFIAIMSFLIVLFLSEKNISRLKLVFSI